MSTIEQKVKEFEVQNDAVVIYLSKSGSKLYGTDTPESDTDYKGLFIPSKRSVLLKEDLSHWKSDTGNDKSKNSSSDIDFQVDSIYKFFRDVSKGETGAVDILFSMFREDTIALNTAQAKRIKNNYTKLLSNNPQAFVGYCVGQSKKYGIKGLRYSELKRFNAIFWRFISDNNIQQNQMETMWEELRGVVDKEGFKYIKFVWAPGPKTQKPRQDIEYLEVLGAKYSIQTSFLHTYNLTQKMEDGFGDRTKSASEGADWKALSHAVRVILEIKELLLTEFITFPLKDAQYITDIKKNRVPLEDVVAFIDAELEVVNALMETSKLPDKVDERFINEFTIDVLDWSEDV